MVFGRGGRKFSKEQIAAIHAQRATALGITKREVAEYDLAKRKGMVSDLGGMDKLLGGNVSQSIRDEPRSVKHFTPKAVNLARRSALEDIVNDPTSKKLFLKEPRVTESQLRSLR